jgi:hypothetical protein
LQVTRQDSYLCILMVNSEFCVQAEANCMGHQHTEESPCRPTELPKIRWQDCAAELMVGGAQSITVKSVFCLAAQNPVNNETLLYGFPVD